MDKLQFQIEAEQLAKIKHDNIIIVYGYTIQGDSVIVMEYCEGGCLAAGLSSYRKSFPKTIEHKTCNREERSRL